MTAAFEIRESAMMIWPKWSRFFAKDFLGEVLANWSAKTRQSRAPPDTEKYGYSGMTFLRIVIPLLTLIADLRRNDRHARMPIPEWPGAILKLVDRHRCKVRCVNG